MVRSITKRLTVSNWTWFWHTLENISLLVESKSVKNHRYFHSTEKRNAYYRKQKRCMISKRLFRHPSKKGQLNQVKTGGRREDLQLLTSSTLDFQTLVTLNCTISPTFSKLQAQTWGWRSMNQRWWWRNASPLSTTHCRAWRTRRQWRW